MTEPIILSKDAENTTANTNCNACIYNGIHKLDILRVQAVDEPEEKKLTLVFPCDDAFDRLVNFFTDHIDVNRPLEVIVYPTSEYGFHLLWFEASDITVYEREGENGVIDIIYTDTDELLQEFKQNKMPEGSPDHDEIVQKINEAKKQREAAEEE